MPSCIVITEKKRDVLLLRAILNNVTRNTDISFVAAGGWSSADSYSRTVLVKHRADVALVVSADTIDREFMESRKRFLKHSLDSVNIYRQFSVTVIQPDIASLIFREHSRLEELVGKPVSQADYAEATINSNRVLDRLLGVDYNEQKYEEKLNSIDWTFLKNEPELHELVRFMQRNHALTSSRKKKVLQPSGAI